MKFNLLKKIFSLFIVLSMVFVAIGCDFSKFGLNFGNEDETGETNKPNEDKPVETPNEEDNAIENLLKYFYDQKTMPYSFTTWLSKFENSDIRIIRDNDTFYFTDATNNRYLYFTFNELQTNPLNIDVLDTAGSIFIKVNNRWIQLFSYDVVSITTKYNFYIYDGFGNILSYGQADSGETFSSIFRRSSVATNQVRSGYRFLGWNIYNQIYSSSELSRVSINSDITIQALWQEENTDGKVEVVIYTYDGREVARGEFNKGTKASTILNTLVSAAELYSLTNIEGETFGGWYIPEVDHTLSTEELSSITINQSTRIQAAVNATVAIQVYDEFDGLLGQGKVSYGCSIPRALETLGINYIPPRSDFELDGWYVDTVGNLIYGADLESFQLYEDTKIYARVSMVSTHNLTVTIDDGFGSVTRIHVSRNSYLSDVLKQNGYDVRLYHDNYDFDYWEYSDNMNTFFFRESDTYGYQIERDCTVTAKWIYNGPILHNVELIGTNIYTDDSNSITILEENPGKLRIKKTYSSSEWSYIAFKFPEGFGDNYNRLVVTFKGPTGKSIIFKVNDNAETWVNCTGEYQKVIFDFDLIFDYTRYSLVLFPNAGISGACPEFEFNSIKFTSAQTAPTEINEFVFYGGTEAKFRSRTQKGYSIDEQNAIVGIGEKSIHIGDKLFVLPRYSLITLGENATEELTLSTKEELQVYGTDGSTMNSTGLEYVKAEDSVLPANSYGHGALYYNASNYNIIISDVANTYGRNLWGNEYGYNRYIFRYVFDDVYQAELITPSDGSRMIDGISITLYPGDYLWCPMTAERYCTGLTDCNGQAGVEGPLYDGAYLRILNTSLIEFPSSIPAEGVVDELRLGEYNNTLGMTLDSLVDAIHYIKENGTIYLGNNVYVGDVNINKSVNIIGVDQNENVPLSERSNGSRIDGILTINSDNVNISGLTFEENSSYIAIPEGNNIHITKCLFRNLYTNYSGAVINIATGSNITIDYCWFIDDILTSKKVFIKANNITNCYVEHNYVSINYVGQAYSNEFLRIEYLYNELMFRNNYCDAFATNLWYLDVRNGTDAVVKMTDNTISGRLEYLDEPGIALYNFTENSIIEIEYNSFNYVNGNTFRFDSPNFVIPIKLHGNYFNEFTHFKLKAYISDDYITFSDNTYRCEAYGDLNGLFPSDYVPIHYADVFLDFIDGTVGTQYNSSDWTQEKYTDKWVEVTGQMNCREKDGVRVVNFVAGYSIPYKYTYNKGGESLGLANTLTLKAGNYFSPNQAIPCKIILLDTDGNNIYLFGSPNSFEDFPATAGLVDQTFTFDVAEIVSIQIVTKSTYNGSQYLYVGDVCLFFDTSTYSDTEAPIITFSDDMFNYLISKEFLEGDNEGELFDSLINYVSVYDNHDGYISSSYNMIDYGGLYTRNLKAGAYVITITATDSSGNTSTFSIPINVFSSEEGPSYLSYTIDFEDGTVGQPYNSPNWKQEVYENGEWKEVSGSMYSREKDGEKVVDMACGSNQSYRYTYSLNDESFCFFDIIFLRFANYHLPNQPLMIKLYAVDPNGNITYFLGGDDYYHNYGSLDGLANTSCGAVPTEAKAIVFEIKNDYDTSSYFYVSRIEFFTGHVFVDANLSGNNYGDIIDSSYNSQFNGFKLVYGINTFATITEALNAAPTTKNTVCVIHVADGEYSENLAIRKSVWLRGQNSDIPGYGERNEETILTGLIKVYSSNVIIMGFKLTNQTQLISDVNIVDFRYSNNYLDGFEGDGYLVSYIRAESLCPCIDYLYIDGNYGPNINSTRVFKFGTVNTMTFIDNKFIMTKDDNASGSYDYMCIQECLYGYVEFCRNYFEGNNQAVFRVLGVGSMTFNIKDNYFKDIRSTVVDTRDMVEDHRGDVQINIIHNTFDHAGYEWCCIRPRSRGYNDNSLDVQVHYNSFINGCNSSEVTDAYEYAENPQQDRQIYNMDNNYFMEVRASDLTNANFEDDAYSWANCYDSIEDLERDYQLVAQNYNY